MKKQIGAKHLLLLLAMAIFTPNASWAVPAQPPSSTEPGVIIRGQQEERRAPSHLEDTVVVPKEEAANKITRRATRIRRKEDALAQPKHPTRPSAAV